MKLALVLVVVTALTGCEGLEIRGSNRPPPTLTCIQHLGECLDTPLGSTEGSWGQSVCVDCYDLCRRDPFGTWPYFTGSFQSCRWWEYRPWITSADAAPEDAHAQ